MDLIITKSVSRFSRNVLDCIGEVRKLASLPHPVGVFFETENIYTLNSDSEMSLSFVSTLAQEESHTKSRSMDRSVDMRFSMGIFLTPALLGYDLDEDGRLIINEDEALTVRLCFFMYLYGYSCQQIAETLMKLGRLTKLGNTKWTAGTVLAVLQNELERSLIAEGCRDPIVIWDGVILDGHHRYEICRRRNIPFQVKDLRMDCREEAIAWICSNQLGRRNISEATRQYLIGKRYQAEKCLGTRNPEGYNQYVQKELSPQNEGKPLAIASKYGIASNLGMEYGVAHSTIERYGRFAGAIDQIKEASKHFADGILSGRVLVNQHDVLDMADLNEQQIRAVARDIDTA